MENHFKNILMYYNDQSRVVDSNNPIINDLVQTIPSAIRTRLERKDLVIKGSAGVGRKADVPWIAIMNKNITRSAQDGIYIVYLFQKNMNGFYLSLNQGITYFIHEFGKNKYKNAGKVADYFRSEITNESFQKNPIYLNVSSGSRGYGYEKCNIVSKYYSMELIEHENLFVDLDKMIEIYDDIYAHMSGNTYEQVIQSVLMRNKNVLIDGDQALDNLDKYFVQEKHHPYGSVKQIHTVKAFQDRSNRFSKVQSSVNNKIDHVQKTIMDMEVGLEGEKLVLEYEINRLKSENLDKYASRVKWVSRESDSFGYDIESYEQLIDGSIMKIYIEVKSSVSKVDTHFYISKNELETSNNYSEQYKIYRLYDINSIHPKMYTASGALEDNFYLDPISFKASYKWKVE